MRIIYSTWDRSEFEVTATSEQDLIDHLNTTKAAYLAKYEHPIAADLTSEQGEYNDGNYLSVGLGAGESIILYFPANGGGYAENSLGDIEAQGTTVFCFGCWTELSRKHVIPWSKAEIVIREWFRTGERSAAIEWTKEIF